VDWVFGVQEMNLCSEERSIQSPDRCGRIGKFFVSHYQGE
jgi:hypothetical protein